MTSRRFATTVRIGRDEKYVQRANILDIPEPKRCFHYRLVDELRLFGVVLRAALGEDALLLFSSRGYFKPELLATMVVGLWPKRWRPSVALYGEMYQPSAGPMFLVERLLMKLADRAIGRYILASSAERLSFSELWNVDPMKLRVCPEYARSSIVSMDRKVSITAKESLRDGMYIFAGGNSFREYSSMVEAAKMRPAYQFRFCTSLLESMSGDLPPNVVAGPVRPSEYRRLMRDAAAVVVPVARDAKRIVGALTYLEAMSLEKVVVVSNAPGVEEYIAHGETGLVVDGTPAGYLEAIDWVLSPESGPGVATMSQAARRAAEGKFSRDSHVERILEIMDEFIVESARS